MTRQPAAVHNQEQQRFEAAIDGQTAYAHYTRRDDRTLAFDHTYVPQALRGRGVAAVVVAAGLDYAREHGLKVVPQCSYVDAFIRRHPEYLDLV